MERVYAEYDLYLQVRQRKNLTSAWEHTNAENVSGERAVKAPYELPHVSGIVQRPREAIIFRLFYQLKATVYLRASKTPAETAELLCKALVRPRRRLSNRWSPQAPQPDSGPDAACEMASRIFLLFIHCFLPYFSVTTSGYLCLFLCLTGGLVS